MFFIQQHRLWKCYMQTFSGQDLLWFACCVSFLFINDFLTNFLTLWLSFITVRYFFCLLTQQKLTWKECQNRWNRDTRTQNFLHCSTVVGSKLLGKFPIPTNYKFFKSLVYTLMTLVSTFQSQQWKDLEKNLLTELSK